MRNTIKESNIDMTSFKLLFDYIDIVFFQLSPKGIITYISPTVERLCGYKPSELIGKHYHKTTPFQELARVKNLMQTVLQGKSIAGKTFRQFDKKKNVVYMEVNAIPLKQKNKIMAIQGALRDVTGYKGVEEELRKSEARYRGVIEDQTELICRFIPGGRLTFVNEAYCRYFGKKYEELIGHSFMSLVPPIDHKKLSDYFAGFSRKKTVDKIEHRVITANGDIRWHEWTNRALFDKHGVLSEFQSVGRDITESKEIEQMKNILIRDFSHGFKTPIAMVEMALNVCESAIKNNDMEQIKKTKVIAFNNLRKLRKDVDNMLEVFTLDMRKMLETKEKKHHASLNIVLKNIIREYTNSLAEKNNKLHIDIMPDADKVRFDQRDLKVLMSHLIDNAVKFTDYGCIYVKSKRYKDVIQISVHDTGCGISEKDRTKVFDRFYKRHPAVEGSGLGLSICKEIVDLNHGEIRVVSKGEGKGTTVIVTLRK